MIFITYNERGIAVKSIQVKEGSVALIKNNLSGRPYVQIDEQGRFEVCATLTIMTDNGVVIDRYTANQLVEDENLRFTRESLLFQTTLFGKTPKTSIMHPDYSFCGMALKGELVSQVFPSGLFGFENKIILVDQATITDDFKVVHGPKELIGMPVRHIPCYEYKDCTIWALSSLDKLTKEVKGEVAINFIDETAPLHMVESDWRTLFWKDPKRVATAIANDVSKATRSAFNEEAAYVKRRD